MRVLNGVLVALIAANILGTISFILARGHVKDARQSSLLMEGMSFPRFSGIDVDDAQWNLEGAKCSVIRITDKDCVYCRKDTHAYQLMVAAARRASCQIVEVAPQEDGFDSGKQAGVVRIKFVDTNIGALLAPIATPQTIVLDAYGKVRMTKRGILDPRSLARGLSILDSFMEPSD